MANSIILDHVRSEIARMSLFGDFDISSTTLAGGCTWVYWIYVLDQHELADKNANQKSLCLRIPKDAETSSTFLRGCILQREFVRRSATILVPTVVHADQKFVIMDRVNGEPVSSWYQFRQHQPHRQRALGGMANVLASLWSTKMTSSESSKPRSWVMWLGH